ncbi:MAG: hypothetical protein KJ944_00025 [Alphaproteobacteria bacterium]|nr:hypothetical protein [Alphaproteobacteria bacterium]MBU1561517.1 hypothetical protein [Alphaproteobacteria bacterium]MBU2300960.1 hypothetical protein [Alphaproteobacteria bacterium]MBU2368411.1 hypothetical protein [Alphaproteobacteria bacterium]
MTDIPPFNADDPRTVHDILWAWSTGSITADVARKLMELDEDDDLLEIAKGQSRAGTGPARPGNCHEKSKPTLGRFRVRSGIPVARHGRGRGMGPRRGNRMGALPAPACGPSAAADSESEAAGDLDPRFVMAFKPPFSAGFRPETPAFAGDSRWL